MYLEVKGRAEFEVKETGEIITIHSSDLDWNTYNIIDKNNSNDNEIVYQAEFEIQTKKNTSFKIIWNLWEYPEGCYNQKETNCPNELIIHQDIEYNLFSEV